MPDEADDFIPEDDREPPMKKRKTGANQRNKTKTNNGVTRQKRPRPVTSQRGKDRGSSSRAGQETGSDSGDEYMGNGNEDDGPSATEISKPRLRPRARPVAKGTRKPDRYDVLATDSEGS